MDKNKKRIILWVLVITAICIIFAFILNSQKTKMKEDNEILISSFSNEKEAVTKENESLKEEISKVREENGKLNEQLRLAREDLNDYGRNLREKDDEILIEAYNLYLKGDKEKAKEKVNILDTTYLTELQKYIYEKIVIG